MNGFGISFEIAESERAIIMDGAAVYWIGFDIAFKSDERHVILIGIVIYESTLKIINGDICINKFDQREIGIIRKRIILNGVLIARVCLIGLSERGVGLSGEVIDLGFDVIIG